MATLLDDVGKFFVAVGTTEPSMLAAIRECLALLSKGSFLCFDMLMLYHSQLEITERLPPWIHHLPLPAGDRRNVDTKEVPKFSFERVKGARPQYNNKTGEILQRSPVLLLVPTAVQQP